MKFKQIYIFNFYLICLLPISILVGPAFTNSISVLIALFVILSSLINQNFNFFFKLKIYKLIAFFYILLILSSLASNSPLTSVKHTLAYSLFFFYLVGFDDCLSKFKSKIFLNLFIVTLIAVIVLFLSVIYEFIVNSYNLKQIQYTGILQDKIMGIVILKFFFIIFGFLNYFRKFFKKYQYILFYTLLLFITLSLILLSGNRTSLFLFIIGFFFLMIYDYKNFILISLIIFLLIIVFVTYDYFNSLTLINRFYFDVKNSIFDQDQFYIFSSHYTSHYITSIKMFLQNPFLGIGGYMFRYECMLDSYVTIWKSFTDSNGIFRELNGCATHSHNYYLQLLAEGGFLAFLFLVAFFIYIFKQIFVLLHQPRNSSNYTLYTFLVLILISIFPASPSLNFFNTWSSSFLYLSLSISLHLINSKEI